MVHSYVSFVYYNQYRCQRKHQLKVVNESDRFLVFTCGSLTSAPHAVAVRRMTHVRFRKHLEAKSLRQRQRERRYVLIYDLSVKLALFNFSM